MGPPLWSTRIIVGKVHSSAIRIYTDPISAWLVKQKSMCQPRVQTFTMKPPKSLLGSYWIVVEILLVGMLMVRQLCCSSFVEPLVLKVCWLIWSVHPALLVWGWPQLPTDTNEADVFGFDLFCCWKYISVALPTVDGRIDDLEPDGLLSSSVYGGGGLGGQLGSGLGA